MVVLLVNVRLLSVTRAKVNYLGIGILVLVTVVWGTTFPIVKNAIESLSPAALTATRFVVAALVLSPWLRFASRQLWVEGGLIALVLFISYLTQVIGLTSISSSRAAFITGLNVIIVPLMLPFLRQRVPWTAYLAGAIALFGIGLMSVQGLTLSFSTGDLWILGCAFFYALYIVMMDRVVSKYDPLPLAAVQVAVVAVLGIIWAAPEFIAKPPTTALLDNWLPIVYLGVVATALTTLAQSFAQRLVAAFQTAVIYALEPVFAAIFSVWWLGDTFTTLGIIGAACILVAMLVSQIDPDKKTVKLESRSS
jgi:drug/metabolite transporter (DMT)-like permease